jgi:enolase-phosphatase E1
VAFVYEVLFPFARRHVRSYLERHAGEPEVRGELLRLREEHAADERARLAAPPWRDSTPAEALASWVAYLHWLMDQDRKSTALKAIQGHVWQDGFERGELRGQVYRDVPRAFARWRVQGREIAIFSSGSVLAQKLLFRHSEHGDLTPFIRAYFDTTTGAKRERASYERIAAALARAPCEILFLSDAAEELAAASAAGMATALCVRGDAGGHATPHSVIHGFDEVLADGPLSGPSPTGA